MTKEELQYEISQLNHNKIVLELATGVGKTLSAILLMEKFGGDWDIAIAERSHKQNWIDEFKKHGKEYLLSRVTIFCHASMHKHNGKNLIVDETHHILSEKKLSILKQINPDRFIGLSATLTIFQFKKLQYVLGDLHQVKYSLSEAIDDKMLPEPIVYLVGVELDNNIKSCEYSFGKDKKVMLTEQAWYSKQSNYVEKLKQEFEAFYDGKDKMKWLIAANRRKKFLGNVKTKYARILLRGLLNKRLIVFASSIAQAETLGANYTIHSKKSEQSNQSLLDKFNALEIDKLFAIGKLKEGVNLNQIECGVVVQLDNQVKYYTQILGRTMRSKTPILFILYVKNTRDEEYVNNVLKDFNTDYIKFITLKDLIK